MSRPWKMSFVALQTCLCYLWGDMHSQLTEIVKVKLLQAAAALHWRAMHHVVGPSFLIGPHPAQALL